MHLFILYLVTIKFTINSTITATAKLTTTGSMTITTTTISRWGAPCQHEAHDSGADADLGGRGGE